MGMGSIDLEKLPIRQKLAALTYIPLWDPAVLDWPNFQAFYRTVCELYSSPFLLALTLFVQKELGTLAASVDESLKDPTLANKLQSTGQGFMRDKGPKDVYDVILCLLLLDRLHCVLDNVAPVTFDESMDTRIIPDCQGALVSSYTYHYFVGANETMRDLARNCET
jgi:hypothetical protein